MFGGIVVFILVILAVLAPILAPYDPLKLHLSKALVKPFDTEFPLGTDDLGRDMLSRLLYGARYSCLIGFVVVAIASVIAVPIGALAGFFPKFDRWIGIVVDILLAFPGILLAMVIIAALGPGLVNVMIAVGIRSMPMYIRVVRGQVLSLKNRDFTLAAQTIGAPERRILFHHILPNCLGPVIVQATINVGTAILNAAALSFLGIGVQPPAPEWGAMLSQTRSFIVIAPHVVTLPGLAIMTVVLGFNLLGDGLRDALDPRLNR